MEIPRTSKQSLDTGVESEKVDRRRMGENAEQRKELKSIFDPLAEVISGRITAAIAEQPIDIQERLREIPQYEIPYDVPYGSIPPGFFEGTEPILPDPAPVDTSELTSDEILLMDEDELHPWRGQLQDYVDRYADHITTDGSDYEKGIAKQLIHKVQRIGEYPDSYRRLNEELDPVRWRQYENAYKIMRDNGQENELYALNKMRLGNGKNRYGAPAKYEKFIMTHANAETNSMFNNIVMPVGEYGEEFSKNISHATLFVMEAIDNAANDEVDAVTEAHRRVLQSHTMRGFEENGGPNSRSTKLTLQEGALSIMQTVAMLMPDKVAGYDDPQRLLGDLVNQGLIEKVTRMVPLGLVAPIALDGDYFPHPVELDSEGNLQLSEEFEEWLHEAHAHYWQDLAKNSDRTARTGYGLTCPASGKRGGVRMFSETLVSVYDAVAA